VIQIRVFERIYGLYFPPTIAVSLPTLYRSNTFYWVRDSQFNRTPKTAQKLSLVTWESNRATKWRTRTTETDRNLFCTTNIGWLNHCFSNSPPRLGFSRPEASKVKLKKWIGVTNVILMIQFNDNKQTHLQTYAWTCDKSYGSYT